MMQPLTITTTMANKWNVPAGTFAIRLSLKDVPGFFSNQLVVDSGTRALIIDDGTYLGEVPPGTYTLQSFTEKLKFWKSQKQVDVVLVRQEDVRLKVVAENLPTAEYMLVEVDMDLVVQIQDIGLFARNLLGSRQEILLTGTTASQDPSILAIVTEITTQGLRETIRRLSIESLYLPETRDHLAVGVREAVQNSLLRYGITCADIQTVMVAQQEYDEQLQKNKKVILQGLETQQQTKIDDAANKERLRQITQQERDIELRVLAQNVEMDGGEAGVSLLLRRNQIKKGMRDAHNSGEFDRLKTSAEYKDFLQQINKQDMLRDDELDEMVALFDAKKDDRHSAREFLVRKLDVDREAELDRLHAAIDHAQKIQQIKYETELVRQCGDLADEQTKRWMESLQLETEKVEVVYQHSLKTAQRQHELNLKNITFMSAEEWEKLLQKQKTSRLQKEIEEEETAAKIRVDRIKDEYEIEQKRRKYAFDKEVMGDQMDQLRTMQAMNREQDTFEASLVSRTKAEQHQYDMDQARLQQETEKARIQAEVDKAKHESQAQTGLRDEVTKLQEQRVHDAQKNMEEFQKFAGQTINAMGQAAGRPAAPIAGSTDHATPRVTVCSGCRADNLPMAKFCANCGKQL